MKRLEIALILGIVLTIGTVNYLDIQQEKLRNDVLRLHVIANSDTEFDQMLKLKVRDRVLLESQDMARATNIEDLKSIVQINRKRIESAAKDELMKYGCTDSVVVSLATSYFPTTNYDTFSFPAGEYEALKISIGKAQGQNWWCVCFPPICTGSSLSDDAALYKESGVDDKNIRLIAANETGDSPYVIKFKLMEWTAQVKEALR